jgi:hypothetical protein
MSLSGYRSRFTGPEIDALLSLVVSGSSSVAPHSARFEVLGDGVAAFDLDSDPLNGVVLVSLNGVIQHDYHVESGPARVRLTEPCMAGDDVMCVWMVAA